MITRDAYLAALRFEAYAFRNRFLWFWERRRWNQLHPPPQRGRNSGQGDDGKDSKALARHQRVGMKGDGQAGEQRGAENMLKNGAAGTWRDRPEGSVLNQSRVAPAAARPVRMWDVKLLSLSRLKSALPGVGHGVEYAGKTTNSNTDVDGADEAQERDGGEQGGDKLRGGVRGGQDRTRWVEDGDWDGGWDVLGVMSEDDSSDRLGQGAEDDQQEHAASTPKTSDARTSKQFEVNRVRLRAERGAGREGRREPLKGGTDFVGPVAAMSELVAMRATETPASDARPSCTFRQKQEGARGQLAEGRETENAVDIVRHVQPRARL